MSIDLDWHKLDSALADTLVELINRQLQAAVRPSFIGPVEVSSFDFGSQPPDIELVDLRNIHPDFLEADGDDKEPSFQQSGEPDPDVDEDGFEWVSRKAVARAPDDTPAYHHLPPHVRYGRGPSSEMFASTFSLAPSRDLWNGAMSMPNLGSRSPFFSAPEAVPLMRSSSAEVPTSPMGREPSNDSLDSTPQSSFPKAAADTPPAAPNLQLHLHITWHSNLRITLTTSLLINYPSPMFMSLPIKLSVTGLLFNGELAVGYEGMRRRVHLCILDGADPYGPAAKRDSGSLTPDETDGSHEDEYDPRTRPVGQRILPNIYIESELGQADKHVLKNVTRVERFIQDIIRKTVEEELVFPNYHVRKGISRAT
jgi:distribution and morphology protein 12